MVWRSRTGITPPRPPIFHWCLIFSFLGKDTIILRTNQTSLIICNLPVAPPSDSVHSPSFDASFRLIVEYPLDMKQEVSWNDCMIGFRPGLCIDTVGYAAQVMQYIKSISHQSQTDFRNGITQPSIPYKIISVEFRIGIACSWIDGKIRRYLEISRQPDYPRKP